MKITVEIEKKKYAYDFSKLKFIQIMLAEERAWLKNDRINFVNVNPGKADEITADMDYKADMAAILFAPVIENKICFADEKRIEVKAAFLNADLATYDKVIEVIKDFFSQRSKRNEGLKSLLEFQGLTTLLRMSQLLGSMKSEKKSEDLETPMSSNEEAI